MIQYFLHCIKAHFPIIAQCSMCEVETIFSGLMWFRTNERKHISYQYQCQDCGRLSYSDEFLKERDIVALSKKCECGGQYRRDKNIFCPNCHHRKTCDNKSEDYLVLSKNENLKLLASHGNYHE